MVGRLVFYVPGTPQTAGSKSAIPGANGGRPLVVESGNRAAKRAWRGDLRDAATRAMEAQGWEMTDAALTVTFLFVRRRPQSHYGTGRNAGVLKDSAPRYPTTRPDLLKVARAVEDALTSVVWVDDAQIVEESLRKAYGDSEGVHIAVAHTVLMDAPTPLALAL